MQHYKDELVRMATKAVIEGRLSVEGASKVQGVSSQLINRMAAWYDTINDPIPETNLVSFFFLFSFFFWVVGGGGGAGVEVL